MPRLEGWAHSLTNPNKKPGRTLARIPPCLPAEVAESIPLGLGRLQYA